MLLPNDPFHIKPKNLDLFGHGGIIFMLVTSVLFAVTYLVIYVLPYTRVRNFISLPVKPSFYNFILVLFLLSALEIVGCVTVYIGWPSSSDGLCLINFVHYLVFTLYIPLVYLIFLNFCHQPARIPFSYAATDNRPEEDRFNSLDSVTTLADDDNDDDHHLNAHQQRQARESGAVLQQQQQQQSNFILNEPVGKEMNSNLNYHKFLYATAVQCPDSITGYSSVEESTASLEFGSGNVGGGGGGRRGILDIGANGGSIQ